MGKAEAKCCSCGKDLQQIVWNTKGDLLVCVNSLCYKYRTPQGSVENERTYKELGDKGQFGLPRKGGNSVKEKGCQGS